IAFIQAVALIITIGVMVLTARRQLRAYVALSGIKIMDDSTPDRVDQCVFVQMKNYGLTPATRIRYWIDMCVREKPLVGILERSEWTPDMHVGVIAPREVFEARARIPLLDTVDERDAFYVHGIVRYMDIFRKEHTTTFRWMRY